MDKQVAQVFNLNTQELGLTRGSQIQGLLASQQDLASDLKFSLSLSRSETKQK